MMRRTALTGALLFAAALWLGPTGTAAAAPARGSAAIISPSPEALVTGRRFIARVKVGPGLSHLRLTLAGRPLTIAKTRPAAGVLEASTSVRGLPRGRVTLALRGRRDDHRVLGYRLVILGRHTPGLLRQVHLPRRAAGAARLKVRLGGRASVFKVTIDGRPVRLLHQPDQPAPRRPAIRLLRDGRPVGSGKPRPAALTTIPLSADDGLRPGRNRVVVSAYRAKTGSWARAVRTVWVSRRVPLVAAGPDRRVVSAGRLRLDGGNSRAVHRGERLRYSWRIVSQPKLPRSQPPARLVDAHEVRPHLVVHRHGTYKVALNVTGSGGAHHQAGRAATASVVKSTPNPSDVTTVDVGASVAPYGVRISTRQPAEPAGMYGEGTVRTTIEGVPLEAEGNDFIETGEHETLLVILNRSTLAVEKVQSAEPENEGNAAMSGLLAEANATASNQLAILTGSCGCSMTVPQEPGVPLSEGFTFFVAGGHLVAYDVGNELGDGGPGAVRGLLRRQASKFYSFTYPEAYEFDTYVEPAEGHLAIDLGGDQIPVQLTGGDTEGIEIAALSPALKQIPTLCATFSLKGNSEDGPTLHEVAELLGEIAHKDQHGVLLLQTIGNPKAESAAWGAIGAELEAFGGTPTVWDTLDGSGNYALVGTVYGGQETTALRGISTVEASGPMEGTEAVQELKRWVGTARGILGRGENGLPVVRASTSLPTGTDSQGQAVTPAGLTVLAEAPPDAWPNSTPPYEAALEWISRYVGPVGSDGKIAGLGNPEANENGEWCYSPSRWDLRAEYCDGSLAHEWGGAYMAQLKKIECPANEAEFTKEQCQAEVGQLTNEFTDIGEVHEMLKLLKEPFLAAQGAVAIRFSTAAAEVEREVSQPTGAGGFPLSASSIGDAFTGPAQDIEFDEGADIAEAGETDGASLFLGLIEAALNLGLGAAETDDGQPAASPFFIEKGELGSEAANRLTDAIDGIGVVEDLIVSDWDKLSTAAVNASTSWSLGTGFSATQTTSIEHGAESWLYEQLVPLGYGQVEIVPSALAGGLTVHALRNVICNRGDDEASQPFEGVSEEGVFAPAFGTGPEGAPIHRTFWVIANSPRHSKYVESPGAKLTKELFKPASAGGPGLYPAPFFTWNWTGRRKTIAALEGEGALEHIRQCDAGG